MNDERPISEARVIEGMLVPTNVPLPAAGAGVPPLSVTDPEFDTYMIIVKALLGGAIEGTAELVRRLERLEAEMRAAEDGPPGPGAVDSPADVARYMLGGMALSAADVARQGAIQMARTSDALLRRTGNTVRPFVNNRLTGKVVGPFDRAFGRLVARGQRRVNGWIALGQAQEPSARLLARQAYLEIVDDFIGHLSENEQLSDLVQEQSVGLANEFVEEVRERTVSADTLAESVVRRILRRPPRTALPPPEPIREAVAEVKRVPRHVD